MAKLFIHIGTHKTGSTAIQHNLRYNKDNLSQKGIYYLQLTKPLYRLIRCKNYDDDMANDLRNYFRYHVMQEKKHNTQTPQYLISWEGFSGDPFSGYSNTKLIAEYLKKATIGIDVTVIVYLRRQDDFIESLYTQNIHQGESFSFQDFYRSLPDGSFNWESFLESYENHFEKENIIVRRYDKVLFTETDSLLKDFYNLIGIDFSSIFHSPHDSSPNKGYSRTALEIARICNPHLDTLEKRTLRTILQGNFAKNIYDKYTYFSDSERFEVLDKHADSNSQVVRKYFPTESGPLFISNRDDIDCIEPFKFSFENTIPILVKLLLHNQKTEPLPFTIRLIGNLEKRLTSVLRKCLNYSKR